MRRSDLLPATLLLATAMLASLAPGCDDSASQFVGECEKNEQCGVGAYCKKSGGAATGLCACRTDEACAEGEICNTQGICQKRSACRSNAECDSAKFCDLASGNCIERTACGTDLHCLPGTVCGAANKRCENGCFDDADCPLYSICDRTGLTSTTALGNCLSGRCGDKTYCDYYENCTGGTCVRDPDPNLCRDCDPQLDDCGNPRNFCLINSGYDGRPENGGPNFCGVECANQDDCPNGYQCGGVILLTQDQCTNDTQCGGNGRRCILGEGDVRGFCTCVSDADCTIDQVPAICQKSCGGLGIQPCQDNAECFSGNCQPTSCIAPSGQPCTSDAQCQETTLCSEFGGQRICLTDGTPCTTSAECLCNAGRCYGSGRPCANAGDCALSCQGGGCLLGAACAPIEGLLCPDVR